MAFKQFTLADGTSLTVYKRRGSRNLRLTIGGDGTVKVTIPSWTAYIAGLSFAESRADWIKAHRRPVRQLQDGQPIGKAHHLYFRAAPGTSKITSRLNHTEAVVHHPPTLELGHPEVQAVARRACVRALRLQAENLLPARLDALARQHGFNYQQVTIKQMKSRWGSCDRDRNIVLNLYLMELPWEHIDYVILHELTHTEVLRHGPDFWQAMERRLPDVKRLRKAVRATQPMA